MKRLIFGLILLLMPLITMAQEVAIHGVVTDKSSGEPLYGVSVTIWQNGKMTRGMNTDMDGKFTLACPLKDAFELHLSYIGYVTQKIKTPNYKNILNISMVEDTKALEDVVVNGFVQLQKSTFTGAVQQITAEDLKQVSNTNVITALAALTPGLEIVQNTAQGSNPNHVPQLIMRGVSSFSNGDQDVNQPTIVLDGTEITMQELYDLDMTEIANITVLKDAAATAMYGSKAANGVIVINRKPLESSKPHLNYTMTGNVQFPDFSDYHILNAADKLEYERLAGLYDAKGVINAESGLPLQYDYDQLYNERYKLIRQGQQSDWMKQPARTAFSHSHSLRMYGGSGNMRYELSGRFGNTQGVMRDDYRRRYSLGFKLEYYIQNKIKISNRTTYNNTDVKNTPYGSFSDYTRMNPYDAMYNADGSVNTNLSWDMNNPLYEALLGSYSTSDITSLSNSTDVRWEINEQFRLTGHFNVTTGRNGNEQFVSPNSLIFKNETDLTKKGYRMDTNGRNTSLSSNIVGTWNKYFQDESLISINAGWELNHSTSRSASFRSLGYFNDKLSFVSNAAGYPSTETPSGNQSKSNDVGFFGNATLSYQSRYFIDGTYRATGSSQFGANNRWGTFWSSGAGWNILREKWMKDQTWIDLLKLRGSLGYTGKVNFSPFQAMTMYQYSNTYEYLHGIGAKPITIGDVNLSWERTFTYNWGLDMSFFQRRLNVLFDMYWKKTTDLLLDRAKAPSTGVTSATSNLGEMLNRGIEFSVDGYIIQKKDFYWKLGFSGYINRNKITKINKALEAINKENEDWQSSYTNPLPQYAEGESVSALKLVQSAGIDPATGREIYIKRDGTLTFEYDSNDRILIGDTEPRFYGNISSSVQWKGITIYAMFSLRVGEWIYNSTRASKVEGTNPRFNADQRVFDDRWKQPGDVAYYKNIADTSSPKQTTRFAEKQNSLQLTSLNISYEIPQKYCQLMHLRNLRAAINATDIFRISNVKIERGTSYLYSRGFEFTLSTTL